MLLALTTAQQAADPAPLGVRILLAVSLCLGAVALGCAGWLGIRERLPRNRFIGVRTSASMRGDETFRVANRIAGPATLCGALVGLVTALIPLTMSNAAMQLTIWILGMLGMVGLALAGGILGHRAAQLVADNPPKPAGCSSCTGCAGAGCAALTN
ncbi:SdpI/YhfL family protein [Tamaricihabitans halophyticus]|uniref:SdpI/YhfL family protein n=1 Tax=Tamaricihabitans halophyticus TaxID=1262583 RepID=A0A4R2R6F3_9PSEU|nr:SdpI family protein [Tamaricihabitans halophyticus]TCP57418.1 SdpI/YhfL family protein [Tamaricihabitans halophyticus]